MSHDTHDMSRDNSSLSIESCHVKLSPKKPVTSSEPDTCPGTAGQSVPLTDVQLVPLAAAGDEDAFVRLWGRYHPLALGVARQIAQRPADAEDAAQLVFQWLLEDRWRLNPDVQMSGGNVAGLVKRLTVYASWRLQRPVQETDVDELGTIIKLARSRWPTPEQRLLAKELRERILAAIKGLYPPYLRRTAELRYLSDPPLSGPAIARKLGIDKSTVPAYLDKCRKRLRPALADLVELPPVGGRARGVTRHVRYDDDRYRKTS